MFVNTGAELAANPEMIAFFEQMEKVLESDSRHRIALLMPTGSGKTQTAFAFAHYLDSKGKTLVYYSITESHQYVARVGATATSDLRTALLSDMADPWSSGASLGTTSVVEYRLPNTRDVLLHHLFGKPMSNDTQSTAATQLRMAWSENKNVVVWLDEFGQLSRLTDEYGAKQWGQRNYQLVLRNLLRAARIPVVVSGTQTRAVNALSPSASSLGLAEQPAWTHLITEIPHVDLRSSVVAGKVCRALDTIESMGVITNLLAGVRPRALIFLERALDLVSETIFFCSDSRDPPASPKAIFAKKHPAEQSKRMANGIATGAFLDTPPKYMLLCRSRTCLFSSGSEHVEGGLFFLMVKNL